MKTLKCLGSVVLGLLVALCSSCAHVFSKPVKPKSDSKVTTQPTFTNEINKVEKPEVKEELPVRRPMYE